MDEEFNVSPDRSVISNTDSMFIVQPPNEHRRGFMGSQSRYRTGLHSQERNGQPSGSFMNGSGSVYSEEENGSVAVLWGTNLDVKEIENKIKNFVRNFNQTTSAMVDERVAALPTYMAKLRQVRETDQYFVNIDATHVYEFDETLYKQLIFYPSEIIIYFDQVLNDIYRQVFLTEEDGFRDQNTILTRVTNLKHKSRMRALNPKDINHLVSIQGIIIKTSEIYPDMKDAHFRCTKCGYVVMSQIDRGRLNEPTICNSCNTRHGFELVHNLSSFTDKQFTKMQETPETVPEGETPQNVTMIMYDDMVDGCKPGDRVDIIGIYRAQPSRVSRGRRILLSLFKTYIDTVSITSTSKNRGLINDDEGEQEQEYNLTYEDEAKIREMSQHPGICKHLEDALAPSIWENEDVKKGILCQLFAGTKKDFSRNNRTKFRNDVNILLVGDPSTAKSQLLQFVHKIVPRGIYTSGKGSSAVGLTAYITKDPETREIVLESGALVLSDKGICCIDEFDKMSDDTKTILHEVMEQQTISIAKNGIVCSLNARTAILAAANPKESRYNLTKSLVYNIMLPPTLLSRFDLIYLMIDKPNRGMDERLATHILTLYSPKEYYARMTKPQEITREMFTKYISYARKNCNPKIPADVTELMVNMYLQMRNRGRGAGTATITATPRQLESLIRISEALAKMRLSDQVDIRDVKEAARLIDVAISQSSVNPATGLVDMDQLNTGFAAQDRIKVTELIPEAIKSLIKKKEELFKNGIRAIVLKDEIIAESEGKIESVSTDELVAAVKDMAEQNILAYYGDLNRDRFSVKLAGRGIN